MTESKSHVSRSQGNSHDILALTAIALPFPSDPAAAVTSAEAGASCAPPLIPASVERATGTAVADGLPATSSTKLAGSCAMSSVVHPIMFCIRWDARMSGSAPSTLGPGQGGLFGVDWQSPVSLVPCSPPRPAPPEERSRPGLPRGQFVGGGNRNFSTFPTRAPPGAPDDRRIRRSH